MRSLIKINCLEMSPWGVQAPFFLSFCAVTKSFFWLFVLTMQGGSGCSIVMSTLVPNVKHILQTVVGSLTVTHTHTQLPHTHTHRYTLTRRNIHYTPVPSLSFFLAVALMRSICCIFCNSAHGFLTAGDPWLRQCVYVG